MGELSISDTYKVLESALRPLSYWYNKDNVEEVAVDSPGGIWLRLRGKHAHPWHYYEDGKLTREFLNNGSGFSQNLFSILTKWVDLFCILSSGCPIYL